jgi:hypothetical protein
MRALIVLLLLTARAHAEDKVCPKPDVDRYLAFFDKLVDIVVADRECDKMAGDVGAHIDANQALVDAANAQKQAGFTLPQDAQDRIHDGVTKMTPNLRACGRNDRLRTAFDKLGFKKT